MHNNFMLMMNKKGVSLPVNVIIILIIAVVAMIVFLLFYFGILSFTQTSVGDIETGTIDPLFDRAGKEAELITGTDTGT